jgi:hypothetical protein
MLDHFYRVRHVRAAAAKLAETLAVAYLLFAVSTVHAQLVNGFISGTVTNQGKSPISEVDVTITNQETQIKQAKKTDEEGRYRFVAVLPGVYTVEFKKTGFQPSSIKDINVTTSVESSVDRDLTVVGSPQNVLVSAEPEAMLMKSSGSIQMTLPGRTLDLTPLSTSSLYPAGARNMGRYALFAAGVVRVAGQNEFSTNGHRGRENNFMMDGVDNNDNTVTLPALFAPPEAIQEFQVQIATYSAEFGRNMGAQVNAVTRSGTNNFHGDLWEFYRGNALEPLSLQSRRSGLTSSPRLVDNQFGGDIGGPIIKGKTFFFGLIQGNRQRAPKAFGLVTIPTAAGLASLSSVPLRAASGTVVAQTQASRQSALDALSFLNSVYPKINHYDSFSTVTVNATPIEMGTYNPLVPMDQNFWYGVARIDHQITSNDRISYRFHLDDRNSPLSDGNLAFGEQWGADSSNVAQNHALSYTKSIGQNFVNEMRFSYARLAPKFTEHDPVSSTVTLSNLFTIGGLAKFPQERLEQTYQFQNVSTYIVNRHSLKFGLDQARTHLFNNNAPNSKGTWQFNNLADFMNNQANALTQLVSAPTVYSFTQLKQAYFFQDDIKVSRSFTANLGLRYESTSVPLGYFGATEPTVLAMNVPGPGKRDTNNWGPRVGFAYSPTSSDGILGSILGGGKSVIRGGFGIGYDVIFYNLINFSAANYPRTNTQANTATTLVDAFPTLLPKTNIVTLGPTTAFVNLPSDTQNPTTNYWSLSLQRQFSSNFIVEVGYTGNRSYHLIRQGQANPGILPQAKADLVIAGCTAANLASCQDPAGFPTSPSRLDTSIASRTLLEATGQATYNAGYIQVDKRLSHGLQFGANYTWSANISDSEEALADNTATDGGIAGSSPQIPQNFLDRQGEKARSAFDRPHRFTVHETYAIPFFAGASKFLKLAFSDWQISGFTELQSGQPFTITVGVDTLGAGTTSTQPARPDLNPGGIMTPDPVTGNFRTFFIPLDGTGIVTAPHVVTNTTTGAVTFLKNSMPVGGTLGRNTFRGPGYSNTNMSLMKRFKITADKSLEIRGDFLNLFNHDNFQNPVVNMSSPNFGKNIFVPLTDARQVLLGAKFRF